MSFGRTTSEVFDSSQILQNFNLFSWVNASFEDSTAQAFEHFAHQMAPKGSTDSGPYYKIDLVTPPKLSFEKY